MKFTVNCKVVSKDVWNVARKERPYLGPRPKANIRAGGFQWNERIGLFMPGGRVAGGARANGWTPHTPCLSSMSSTGSTGN